MRHLNFGKKKEQIKLVFNLRSVYRSCFCVGIKHVYNQLTIIFWLFINLINTLKLEYNIVNGTIRIEIKVNFI